MTFVLILAIALIAILTATSKKVYQSIPQRNMAKWARKRKGKARLLLVVFNLLMAACGATIGYMCYQSGLELPKESIYIGLGLFVIGTILYPTKNKGALNIPFRYKQKQLGGVLRMSGGAIAMIGYTNSVVGGSAAGTATLASVHPALWIVLATFGLLIFGFIILAFSCALACEGYEAAALMLAVLGIGGLITLYVLGVIRWGKQMKARQEGKITGSEQEAQLLDDDIV